MTGDTLLGWYSESLFWQFPIASTAISMGAFLCFALPLTWIAANDPAWARPYRIQSRKARPGVFWPSIKCWLLNNLWLFGLVILSWPLLRLTGVHAEGWPLWWEVILSVLFFIYLDDFIYYWFHRLMHTRWWFRRVHGWHHRIYTPWAITGNYMHPFEYVMTGSIALIGPILLSSHVLSLWIWAIFRQWEAAEGHCGYAFPWSPTRFLPLSDSALHHDYHHSKVRGNYAGFLAWCDKVFNTTVKGYTASVAAFHKRS